MIRIIAFICMLAFSAFAENSDKYWVQLMPKNQRWLRVITENNNCPNVIVDGTESKMRYHAKKNDVIQVTSCKFTIPQNVKTLSVNGNTVNLPTEFKKILVIGDTGCRIKGIHVQDCKNDWPFQQIAELAAQHKPDLIMHVGDYFYRDFCSSAKCMGEHVGDNWQSWDDDFFQPASKLLPVAPWVMVRGNHEACGRGGKGWSHFMDNKKKCHKYTKPYSLDLTKDLHLIIADSAAHDLSAETIDKINDLSQNQHSWLLTHRPVWKIMNDGVERKAESEKLSGNISTIFSGHFHTLQVSADNGNKVQVISGNSGSSLYSIDKMPADITKKEFGFIILDKQNDNSWKLNAFNLKNEVIFSLFIN